MYAPSPDLAYLIGAIKGDGYVFRYTQKRPRHVSTRYCVRLTTVDFEFISEVRKAMGKIVGRCPKISILHQHHTSVNPGGKIFALTLCDKKLFSILNQPIERLKRYIELFPTGFLRGFFDAEGSAWIVKRKKVKKKTVFHGKTYFVNRFSKEPVVKFCNTDKKILEYIRELLIRLDIFPAPKMFETMGNLGKNRKVCYNIHIYRKDSIRRFMSLIGSSIPRKRLVL